MALPAGNEFDYARKRAAQQEASNLQQQKDALARRQAQTGGGVSGALMKQEQVASDASAQRLQQANEGIDTAQRAEERRIREIEEGRRFTTSEREAAQGFAAGESALARRFQTGEREASQGFASGESALQRRFLTGERMGSQDFSRQQQLEAFRQQTGERLAGERFQGLQNDTTRALQERMQQQAFRQQSEERKASQAEQFSQQKYLAESQFAQQKQLAGMQGDLQKELLRAQQMWDGIKFDQTMAFSREQFEHEKDVDDFNMKIAQQMADQKGPLEALFGNFGGLNPFNKDSGLSGMFKNAGLANPMNPDSFTGW